MLLFLRFLLVFNLFQVSSFAQVVIDVSGAEGLDAKNGTTGPRGSSGGGSGGTGGTGTPASQSTPGKDADDISVNLKIENKNVHYEAKILEKSGSSRKVEGVITEPSQTKIDVNANGGRGGNGGIGGEGGVGGTGSDGKDASRFSSATSGSPGGPGGPGGPGSRGSDGGNAGNIVISAKNTETDLFLLIGDLQVNLGKGGVAGKNGNGGDGGKGGEGGDSYTWTTSYSCGYGKRRRTCYQTHRKPGGSDGSDGMNGTAASANVEPGKDGKAGRVQFQVGKIFYDSIYDIHISSFGLVTQNEDGIIEPGEQLQIHDLVIQNVGGMPTPATIPSVLKINTAKWILTSQNVIALAKPIQPGETVTVKGPIVFNIEPDQDSRKRVGEPLNESAIVSPSVHQPRVGIDYGQCLAPQEITVQYPLKIERIFGKKSLIPGERINIRWKVTNISEKSYGSGGELARSVATVIRSNCDLTSVQDYEFYDSAGNKVDIEKGFKTIIPVIEPGESIVIAGSIFVPESTDPYRKFALNAELHLGSLDQNTAKKIEAQKIQTRSFVVNVAHVYHHRPKSEIVLVTNRKTTLKEIHEWQKLLERFGLSADVWDLSMRGGINLETEMSSGEMLYDEIKNKTIILINNEVDSFRPSTLFSKQKARELMFPHSGRLLIVGGDGSLLRNEIKSYVSGIIVSRKDSQSASARDFEHLIELSGSINSKNPPFIPSLEWIDETASSEVNQQKDDLKQGARKVSEALLNRYPFKRFSVVYTYRPQIIEPGVFNDTIRLGYIRIFPGVKRDKSFISGLIASDQEIHTPGFIKGYENTQAVLASLPFKRKMVLIKKILNAQEGPQNIHDLNYLRKAIWTDVVGEWNASILGEDEDSFLFSDSKKSKLRLLSENFLNELKDASQKSDQKRINRMIQFSEKMIYSLYRYAYTLDQDHYRESVLRKYLLDYADSTLTLIYGSSPQLPITVNRFQSEAKLLVGTANLDRRYQMRLEFASFSARFLSDLSLNFATDSSENPLWEQNEFQNYLNQNAIEEVKIKNAEKSLIAD